MKLGDAQGDADELVNFLADTLKEVKGVDDTLGDAYALVYTLADTPA